MSDSITNATVESIVTQFHGGEHRLAGARASELVYGTSKTPDQKLMEELKERATGIERYISAPETPVTYVTDQGGNPLATQPENDPEQLNQTNMSSEASKADQNRIDDRLKDGRERREKADIKDDKIGTTKLNPAGSDKDTKAPQRKTAAGPGKD